MGKQMIGGVAVTMPKRTKTGNKHKFFGRNNRPSRTRYWSSTRLMDRKVRNLVRCCGMTYEAAKALWLATRTTRVKR